MKRKPFWIISLLCIVFARSKTDEENFAKQEVFPVKVIQTICGETVLKYWMKISITWAKRIGPGKKSRIIMYFLPS